MHWDVKYLLLTEGKMKIKEELLLEILNGIENEIHSFR